MPARLALCILLLAGAASAETEAEVRARAGEPFGVAHLTVPLNPVVAPRPLTLHGERVHYPAFVLARDFGSVEVYFLFRGEEPLEVVFGQGGVERTVKVTPGRAAHELLRNAWWEAYVDDARRMAREDVAPRRVRHYLVHMLARRLGLAAPSIDYSWLGRGDLDGVLGFFLGTESIRIAAQRDTMLAADDGAAPADQRLPEPARLPAVEYPEFRPSPIEPLALRVPRECFYLRARNAADLAWFLGLLDEWGGDLRNLVAVRGVDYSLRERIAGQLGLDPGLLDHLARGAVVDDLALIGTDSFLREGAALGILFHARDPEALERLLLERGAQLFREHEDAEERLLSLAGREVRFAGTPDHRLRSFQVADGAFRLVTNSETIARRFLETREGGRSLGATKEFRYLRSRMSLARPDQLFLYLSDSFFRGLTGPHYRVEMTRRLRASTEIELALLARLAARAESRPAASIADLVGGGYLPRGFGERPDGSRPLLEDGGVRDSLRGGRGHFLPVPDVPVERVTRAEAQAYRDFARLYESQWERIDPVAIGILRETDAARRRERVVLDIRITPYARRLYDNLQWFLGAATDRAYGRVPGDIAGLEVSLAGVKGRPSHAVAGLRDEAFAFHIEGGQLATHLKAVDAWCGTTPGNLVHLLVWGGVPPEGEWVRRHDWWWRARGKDALLLGGRRKETVREVERKLQRRRQPRPAQVRLWIGDLGLSEWAPLVRTAEYLRAWRVSDGNALFLEELEQQFGVAPADVPRTAALLLHARPVCPLGGRYHRVGRRWCSTAWRPPVPRDYEAPVLRWFRGLEVEFTMTETTLLVRAQLEVRSGIGAGRPVPGR